MNNHDVVSTLSRGVMRAAYGMFGVSLATLLGCTLGSSSQSPQSHFAFPNSNVVPLAEATGSNSRLCGLLLVTWGSPNGEDQDKATRDALESGNGDILINVRTESSLFFVPYLFAICTTKVRGTAAKMEVGRQQLGAMNTATPARPPPPPPPVSAPQVGGCTNDQACKGQRVCIQGVCANP